jgi:hypothetical protein
MAFLMRRKIHRQISRKNDDYALRKPRNDNFDLGRVLQ